jgi:hypothetical protein
VPSAVETGSGCPCFLLFLLLLTAVAQAQQLVSVTSLSPTRGPVGGGTLVTIRGTGFQRTCDLSAPPCGETVQQVHFGSTPAASFMVVSDDTVTAVTPPHAEAVVDVTVRHVLDWPVLRSSFAFGAATLPPSVPTADLIGLSAMVIALIALAMIGLRD